MKTLHLLSGVAATVLLGAGVTFAQAPQAPEKAPAAQQQAPAEKMAPANKTDDKKETTGQAPSGTVPKSASDPKMNSKPAADANTNDAAKGAATANPSTTGQGAAAGAAKLSAEQQTKITTTFKSAKIQSVPKSQINVSIAVGTKLPSTLRFTPVPAEVVTVYPQWRGYYVILVDGQYIVVEPRTHEIVYIIV